MLNFFFNFNKFYYKAILKQKKILFNNRLGSILFRLINCRKPSFICPICKYSGPFLDLLTNYGKRKHAVCPKCGAFERHRLQYLVIENLAKQYNFSKSTIIHFSPEPFFSKLFSKLFCHYFSADLNMRKVNIKLNMIELPFKKNSCDLLFASHVLEYIKEDELALLEISRVLNSIGIAILPVTIVQNKTIEYPKPNQYESGGHVRAPGPDYYDKYLRYFKKVKKFDSNCFPKIYQLFIYENRTIWPKNMPLRNTMKGERHINIVPVCYK